MQDVIYLLITVGFFGICLAMLRLCERIIGPDPTDVTPSATTTDTATPIEVVAIDAEPAGASR